MEDSFVSLVGKALELVRKRDKLALGKHAITELTVVRRRALPTDPPTVLGQTAMQLLGDLLDSKMRPEGERDVARIDWRRYLLLQEYVFRSRTIVEAMDDLGIREALFYETKSQATEMLANELWAEELHARQEIQSIPHSIPPTSFDFVRRADREGRDLVELVVHGLQNRPWVVSIRGFSGVGKTTLAIEAAWAAVRRGLFNRVAWVDVTPDQAESPELLGYILDTIGKRLGTRNVLAVDDIEERRRLVLGLLLDVKCLVVIDSTERVPDAQHEQIVQLVRDLPLPTCAIIVSREMQRKTELETMIDLEGMQENEALDFLTARAGEQSIGLDDQQAHYLLRVTSGNPRAMLLALGWMAKYGLPAADVLDPKMAEMSELLDHLSGRVYERLDEDEEVVLNVMPLFAEPVTRSPIAAASGLALEPVRLKAALGNLHSRFLLDVDGKKRYSVAPLTHMFLRDRAARPGARTAALPARDFWAQAHDRLVDHCLEEFEKAKPYERSDFVRDHRQTILDEIRWASDHGQHRRLTDLMFYVGGSLGELGYWRDKLAWGQSALEAAQNLGDRRRAAWHRIYDVGWTQLQRGENDAAERITMQALSEARELGYSQAECIALRNLALIAMQREDYETAINHIMQSIAIAEAEDTLMWLALAKSTLGEIVLRLRRADQDLDLFHDTLSLYEQIADPTSLSIALSQMSLARLARGELDQATESLERAMALARDIPDPSSARARALFVKGKLDVEQGLVDKALQRFRESLDMYASLGQALRVQEVQRHIDETDRLPRQAKSSGAG
ncbi:MAG TPA: tetratricopeptide repeat protein [Anaerolineae bacterium]|nr:tetratricopeptide repeat protein [Anaerolineae bacterium]